jgi:hypothetical protein
MRHICSLSREALSTIAAKWLLMSVCQLSVSFYHRKDEVGLTCSLVTQQMLLSFELFSAVPTRRDNIFRSSWRH